MSRNKTVKYYDDDQCRDIAMKIIDMLYQHKCDYYTVEKIMEHVLSLIKMQAVQSSDTFEL